MRKDRAIRVRADLALGSIPALLTLILCFSSPTFAQRNTPDLIDQSLDDLLNIKVTSVSRTEQSLSRTASAVFVISAEDIQHSGANNIPDLLRMVPGIDVAQINSNTWAITARGLNARFSNELLVMIDGRNVYTPTFGGVFWDTLDFPLEDIARIEVIRGPGATIWGVNAVNGVINIIKRNAAETKGGMVTVGGGSLEQGFGTVQYGGKLGKSTDYRVFTKYFNQDQMQGLNGAPGADGWHLLRGGFRTDTNVSARDKLTTQGDIYGGSEASPTAQLFSITSPAPLNTNTVVPLSGGFLQSIWTHAISAKSETTLQIYFDQYKRADILDEKRNTVGIDFQHHFAWGDRQNVVWGGGYSFSTSSTAGNLSASLNPPNRSMQLSSAFAQDEIALIRNQLYVTVGTKLEHNPYTGFSWMPSVRMSWTPSSNQMFWTAISRAHRTPAETDIALRTDLGAIPSSTQTPNLLVLMGNPHFNNEALTAFEFGYRTNLSKRLSVDIATFYDKYDSQQTTEPGQPFFENSPSPSHLVLPLVFINQMFGEGHGFETALNWKPAARWTLSPGYAFEQIHMHLRPNSQDVGSVRDAEGSTPVNSAQLRSHVDLARTIGWDVSTYFVDRLSGQKLPSHTRVDTRLSWRCTESLSIGVVGQNLLKSEHPEFVDNTESVRTTLIGRSAYAKLTWQF